MDREAVDADADVSDPFETEIGGVPSTAIDALNTREWRAITLTRVGENFMMYFEADDAVRIHILEVEGHAARHAPGPQRYVLVDDAFADGRSLE
jgi:hypothetical protein